MKIEPTIVTKLTSALSEPAAQTRPAMDATKTASTTATKVQLSAESKLLEELIRVKLSDVNSTFDAKKVESIRAAIAEGSFKVNAGNVADGLLQSVRDLIHKNPQVGGGPGKI